MLYILYILTVTNYAYNSRYTIIYNFTTRKERIKIGPIQERNSFIHSKPFIMRRKQSSISKGAVGNTHQSGTRKCMLIFYINAIVTQWNSV